MQLVENVPKSMVAKNVASLIPKIFLISCHNDKSLDLDMLDIQSLNKAASEDGELPEVCIFYDKFHLADFIFFPHKHTSPW